LVQKSTRDIAIFENVARQIPPALLALFIQIISIFLCLISATLLEQQLGYSLPIFICVVSQAALAAFFSFMLNMDWWWRAIQFFFPILVVLFASAKIPSYYYLLVFLVFALVYWSSFRTRVPYYPSKPSLLPAILELLPKEEPINFVDVGSGMGGLLVELANVSKGSRFSGIEIAPFPWFVSFIRGRYCKSGVRFIFGDYERLHFSEFDVVFAYLSPAAMPGLWIKAKREMRSGTILLSYEFIIPDVEPDLCINRDSNDPTLYLWRI
jgi:hypothetical protein